MIGADTVYKDGFFRKRAYLKWRSPYVCGAIAKLWKFESVMDVGCGGGDLVAGFAALGKKATGLECSAAAVPYLLCDPSAVLIHDLQNPLPEGTPRVDLVTCFEVMEHVAPETAGKALDNLCQLSDQLVTSISGAHGRYHLQVQPRDWWERKFNSRGYVRDVDRELELLKLWQPVRLKTGIRCFWDNLICFERKR